MDADGPSGFRYAPVTKLLVPLIGGCSLVSTVLELQELLPLQLFRLVNDKEFWRLFTTHWAFNGISTTVAGTWIAYKMKVVERRYGSAKYAALVFISFVASTLLQTGVLMLGTRFTWLKSISSGPYAILFSIIYQYKTLVPPSYQVKMLGTSLSDKTYVYFAATQLFLSNHNSSIIPCLCGLAIGAVYDNSNILKRWRFPRWLRRLTSKYIVPVLGTNKPSSGTSLNNVSNSVRPLSASTATTMPNVQSSSLARSPTAPRSSRSLKEEDINTMFAMFPNYSREDIKNALIQSNSNLNRAAEILLTTEPSAGSSNNNNSSQ